MKINIMKKLVALVLCAALLLPSAACGATAQETKKLSDEERWEIRSQLWKKQDTTDTLRGTSFDLFKKLALKNTKSGKNTMISPVSLIVALGMLENGARGESLSQIEKAFGVKVGELNEWYKLWSKLQFSSGEDTLKLANSVWYREESSGLRVKNEFLKVLGDIYLAEAISAKFDESTVKDVNGWVNKNTDGMIDSIIDKLDGDSSMLLINATAFKGVWADEYKDKDVRENVKFKRENGKIDRVTMLSSTENRYFENKYLTGTKKHYKDGYYIMLMLPKKGYTVSNVLEKMSKKSFDKLVKSEEDAEVHLKLPCFKYEYKVANCRSALKKMGIADVFDKKRADLSGMATIENGDNLYVDKVIHKTFIELDREGTKAAAVTAIDIKCTAMPMTPKVKKVTLNRPFIYAICDEATGIPVFMGTVSRIG